MVYDARVHPKWNADGRVRSAANRTARVLFDDVAAPHGVERLGIALEREADYERRLDGAGGRPSRLVLSPLSPGEIVP